MITLDVFGDFRMSGIEAQPHLATIPAKQNDR